jgi:hypothetical protein
VTCTVCASPALLDRYQHAARSLCAARFIRITIKVHVPPPPRPSPLPTSSLPQHHVRSQSISDVNGPLLLQQTFLLSACLAYQIILTRLHAAVLRLTVQSRHPSQPPYSPCAMCLLTYPCCRCSSYRVRLARFAAATRHATTLRRQGKGAFQQGCHFCAIESIQIKCFTSKPAPVIASASGS